LIRALDDVLRSEGIEVLIVGRGRLEQVLGVCVDHYNVHEYHRQAA
jgi:hypothetical protein